MLINPQHPMAAEAISRLNSCRQAQADFHAASAKGDLKQALHRKAIFRDRCQNLFCLLEASTGTPAQPTTEEPHPC